MTESQLDSYLGNAFTIDVSGTPTAVPFSKLPTATKADFRAAALNAKKIAGLQAVEGMVLLFVLLIWAFLGVLVNIYATKLGRLSRKDRGNAAGVACEMLVASCFAIAVLLPVLAGLGLKANLTLGVVSAFCAVATIVAMWMPFIVALGILFNNQAHTVLRIPFWTSIAHGKDK
jgi:hypothetical protein